MKRGQSAAMSAILVAIIAAAIILYILMIPPADRSELLGENITKVTVIGHNGDNVPKRTIITTLIERRPGKLAFLDENIVEINLPSFNLFTKTSATVLTELDSVHIKKSLFDEVTRNISFTVADIDFTDNLLLSFVAPEHDGRLTIQLNGNVLLEKEYATQSPEPLQLPKDMLRQNNVLTFAVSGPGIAFWKTNQYTLENMKIVADITDISGQNNQQSFFVSEKQQENMEFTQLEFIADCTPSEAAPLDVYLNDILIFSGIPDCGIKTSIPRIDPRKVLAGDNMLLFQSSKGSYLIYALTLNLNLKKPVFPTYDFTLNKYQIEKIKNNLADVNITLQFTNPKDFKSGVIYINGFVTDIATREAKLNRLINEFVMEGDNTIELRPRRESLEMVKMSIIFSEAE